GPFAVRSRRDPYDVGRGVADPSVIPGSANTSRRAANRRQSFTFRWSVRSWPALKSAGRSCRRRSNSSLAVPSGSHSSHITTCGQVVSNGSDRVLQWRGGVGPVRGVGRTSPSLQAFARLFRTIEIGVAMWKHVNAFARGESSQVVLDGANLIEQSERVER